MALEKALRNIVLVGAFALPFIALYVANSMFFPFITGKNFAFRIIVELIAGAWLALAFVKAEYRPKSSGLLWGFAAFVVLIGISDLFGTYPFKSFWSNYERMEGWITLAHLFVYFCVTTSILNTEKLWRYWWHTSLFASLLVGFYGLIQLAGLAVINQGGVRIDSRLGNATYLAIYMYFHVFMAALFLARAWVEKGPGKRTNAVLLYGGIMLFDAYILFFTATRGAILGLLGGSVLAAFILIALAPRSRIAWRAGVGIGVLVLLSGMFWAVADQPWVRNIEPLYRLSTIVSEGVPGARVMNVQMALEGFKERPILGWGQENYAAVFDKYYNPNMHGQEQWFDRTHNVIFDWLIAGGIFGLLAYLSLYFFALLMVWRSGAFEPYERAILTGLFAGYFFYLLFTFDNITSYVLFVSLLGYITVRAHTVAPAVRSQAGNTSTELISQKALPMIAIVTVLGSFGVLWYVNADAITANRTLIRALSPQAGGPTQNLELFEEALSYGSLGTQEIREQLAQAAMGAMGSASVPNDLKQKYLTTAANQLSKQGEESPHNARPPFFLGLVLDRAGALPEGKIALERAQSISPTKQAILIESGLNALARGQNEEALGYFKRGYELAPEYRETLIYYAALLIQMDRESEADAVLKPVREMGSGADARIAQAYAARGKFAKIAEIWIPYIEKNPTDLEARMILAGSYFSAKDTQNALRVLEDAKQAIPSSAAQVDPLIEQVKSGKIQ